MPGKRLLREYITIELWHFHLKIYITSELLYKKCFLGEPPVSLQSPGVLLPFALRKEVLPAACRLVALLLPLPSALLPPQPALLQQGAKSESAPT